MVELELTRAEALLAFELIKHNAECICDQILDAVNSEVNEEELQRAAQRNYVINLEEEVKNLRAMIDSKNLASDPAGLKPKAKKVDAPWGLKKDGTPKKRPGRQVE